MTTSTPLAFHAVAYPEPHLERTRRLLQAHPELRTLFGPLPSTAWFVLGLVAVQVAVAVGLRHASWWLIALLAYTFGAVANHALWTLIHDCTHNLVFRRPRNNALLQIFANLPIIFPAAISFRKYHLLHHRFQGDPELDADLASPAEARFVGNSRWRKAFWLLGFFLWQAARVPKLKRIKMWDHWYALNLGVQIAFVATVYSLLGGRSLLFLVLSSIFSIGLHPLGARWIQEHYLLHEDQETFSYYGPLNHVAFNVGYHNEHHDLMMVAWSKLPIIRAKAPEFYEPLHSYRSWTGVLLRFIFDKRLTLYSRRVRIGGNEIVCPKADTCFIESIPVAALTDAKAA